LIIGLSLAALFVLLVAVVVAVTALGARERRQQANAAASNRDRASTPTAAARPRVGRDHWHVAYRVVLCNRLISPVAGNGDKDGIHSHGDGLIHVEPSAPGSAGAKATFRRFEEAQGLEITSTSLRWREETVPVEAEVSDGCSGAEAEIVTFVNGRRTPGPPGPVRLRDGQEIVVALVPIGTQYSELIHP